MDTNAADTDRWYSKWAYVWCAEVHFAAGSVRLMRCLGQVPPHRLPVQLMIRQCCPWMTIGHGGKTPLEIRACDEQYKI